MKNITLPNWLPIALIEQVFKILEPYGTSRLVGGCVRDIVAQEISKDLDIATTVLPEQGLKIFASHKIKVIPTGIKHGTVTAIIDGKIFEITTLRKDIECFGRHAEVEFTDDWEEDAKRRDFTINAMSMDLDGTVYDYFGGIEDLQKRIIRFVGKPKDRIKEDYLRILRYFRFYSYFGGTNIDSKSLSAVVENVENMKILSGERVHKEIMRLLSEKYAKASVLLMTKNHIWEHIAMENPDYKLIDHFIFSDDPIVNLAAIMRTTKNPEANLEKIAFRWRLSNKERSLLKLLCRSPKEIDPDNTMLIKRAMYLLGKDSVMLMLDLLQMETPNIDFYNFYTLVRNFKIPKFPLSGRDFKKLGFEGKIIGEKITYATELWINSDFRLKKSELLTHIKNL